MMVVGGKGAVHTEPLVDAPPVNLHALANHQPVEIDIGNLSLAVVGSTKALQKEVSPHFLHKIFTGTDPFILPNTIDDCTDEGSIHIHTDVPIPVRMPDLGPIILKFERCVIL
jgi:hypothetical protein